MKRLLHISGLLILICIAFACCSKDDNGPSDQEAPDTTTKVKIPLITFEPTDSTWKLRLTNPDDSLVRWRVDNEIWWLTCEPSSGRIKAKGMDSLMLIVDRTGCSAGEYDGSFYITVGKNRRQVDVIMKVE